MADAQTLYSVLMAGALREYNSRASIALGASGNWEINASIKMFELVTSPIGQMKPTMEG